MYACQWYGVSRVTCARHFETSTGHLPFQRHRAKIMVGHSHRTRQDPARTTGAHGEGSATSLTRGDAADSAPGKAGCRNRSHGRKTRAPSPAVDGIGGAHVD
jgi:hypothetical protein